MKNLHELEKACGYVFRDPSLLTMAVTHTSYANEHRRNKTEHNERLEYLGDAILDLVAAEYLYRKYPELVRAMDRASVEYNEIIDLIERDTKTGRTFCQAPEEPVEISRFEGDVEKLGALYERGYTEMKKRIPELKAYLAAPTV